MGGFKQHRSRDSDLLSVEEEVPESDAGLTHLSVLADGGPPVAAMLLDDDDRETLRHLIGKGTAANTKRAYERDLAYLQTWALAATGERLPWPAPVALILKFIAHHLFDPEQRAQDSRHGMPESLEATLCRSGLKARPGPSRPATVQRRLAVWSTLHKSRGLDSPLRDPKIRSVLKKAVAASAVLRQRKSAKAITLSVLRRMLATCDASGWGIRDRALLSFMFGSGGRRRSEASALTYAQLQREDLAGTSEGAPVRPAYRIALGRTKTRQADEDKQVWLVGKAALDLDQWLTFLHKSGILPRGPVFRPIARNGHIGHGALSADAVADVVKRRVRLAGYAPQDYSAHGIRAGYLTEAANQGVPLPQAMMQSDHRDVKQAARYYNEADIARSLAAALMDQE